MFLSSVETGLSHLKTAEMFYENSLELDTLYTAPATSKIQSPSTKPLNNVNPKLCGVLRLLRCQQTCQQIIISSIPKINYLLNLSQVLHIEP